MYSIISAGHSQNSYRGLVRATSNADNARNYSSCDSLLLGCPGLYRAAMKKNVTLVNAIGNGVADDKSVYPYVPGHPSNESFLNVSGSRKRSSIRL